MDNRPKGREQNITGQGKDIYKKGDGLNTGPVGSQNGYSGRGGQSSGGKRQTRGGGLIAIILAVIALLGGGAGISGLLGGGGSSSGYSTEITTPAQTQQPSTAAIDLSSLFGGYGSTSDGWLKTANTGTLDTTVAEGSRAKRTNILGNGNDTVTIMVYMCGTDLESKYGMGTSDLTEMANATLSDKVNIIVYTGGCKQWKNSVVSNSVNQIYKVERGGLRSLVKNAGTDSMMKASTLTSFINYCTQNYPANRNELIFWDHGGGSITGYGYDETNRSAGTLTLSGINSALKAANTTFDFIGFDACLMGTLENGLMLADYADYLIASEETEPGVGWYYTNWLSRLSENTSMSTLEIGKTIVDDFVSVCSQKCRGQDTTLSLVDLAELENTVPAQFKSFAKSTSNLISGNQFKTVSKARSDTREFASKQIDQVDLVHLAANLGTSEGEALTKALLGAVKYNKTSNTVTNAYGISIYFPYQKTSKVKSAVNTYNDIGIDSEYSRCIQQFASLEAGGSTVGGTNNSGPMGSLLGQQTSSQSIDLSGDMISQLLGTLMGGGMGDISFGRSIDEDELEEMAQYISENRLDPNQLVWVDGKMTLTEEQWSLVNDIDLNVFYDDGEGYIDLGLDNVFEFTDSGELVEKYGGTWLAINDQPVPYYHTGTVYDGDDYTISGRIPVLINGDRANLIVVFDNENPYGYIAGFRLDYDEEETEVIAKAATELTEGDEIEFVCDYYTYDGEYQNSYLIGDTLVYDGNITISDVYIDAERANACYRFTDIYNQHYWSPVISK